MIEEIETKMKKYPQKSPERLGSSFGWTSPDGPMARPTIYAPLGAIVLLCMIDALRRLLARVAVRCLSAVHVACFPCSVAILTQHKYGF